ncbi:RDD family protein [Streptomyces sp. NPDC057705]|uniref:RDD family protein n=1 Tax=Streptomyces sp. NPDC057705 TaxID=3346222 RepID=UPI0036C6C615
MTASPGDGEHAAREGYYPDPSIPGYIRYWNGAAWVPGTSRPAPAQETGPVFLDETSVTEALPEPEPDSAREPERGREREREREHGPEAVAEPEPAVWQADPLHQAGFGGPRDHRVSWGSPPEPEPGAGQAAARSAGISLARTAAAAAAPARLPAQAPMGILSARSPAAQAAPAPAAPAPAAPAPVAPTPVDPAPVAPAPAWPDAPGAGVSGVTSSWPGAAAPSRPAAPAPAPAPAPSRPAAPADPRPEAELPAAPRPGTAQAAEAPRHEVWAPRPAGVRPKVPSAGAPAPAEPRSKGWEPSGSEGDRPGNSASRPAGTRTPREVFERMAERAVRPAGLMRRAMARVLDSLVLAAVAAAVARPLLPEATAHVQAKVDAARASGRTTTVWLFDATIAGHLGLVLGAVLLFGVLYEALPTALWGRTAGKKLLGVRVLATATLRPPGFGAALRRWLVYAFLGFPGSLWCLVDRPRRQAWHDKAARTYVAR